MHPDKKKKVNRVLITVGIIAAVLGFLPGFFIPYWLGLVVLVFCLVGVGLITVVIPNPEVQPDDLDDEKNDEKK